MIGPDRRMHLFLSSGLALVLLAWWCGPQSYGDLREYAQMCDNLWTHGTFAFPDGHQSRMCWGFPVLMLPLRALGALPEALTGRNDLAHWVTATAAPLACLVIAALIARQARRAGLNESDSVRAALLTVLAAGTLSYSRMFNFEPVVGALLIAAVVLAEEARGVGRAVATGTCLGAAFACHFANGACIGVLAVGLAWRLRYRLGTVTPALALGISALLWVGLTAWINEARYGSAATSGYSRSEKVSLETFEVAANLPYLGLVLLMVPWFPATLAWIVVQGKGLSRLLVTAIALQTLCWLCSWQFSHFSLRYMTPMIILAGLLLPECVVAIRERMGRWAGFILSRGSVMLLAWGMLAFLPSGGFCRPILFDTQHALFPGQPLAAMWYQPRTPYVYKGDYVYSFPSDPSSELLYPERPITMWSVLVGLLLMSGGAWILCAATRPSKTVIQPA